MASVSGDSDDAVWADPEKIFVEAATIRGITSALPELSLTPPTTGGVLMDMLLSTVATKCGALSSDLAESFETIAKALTVGAIDAYRADQ